MTPEFWVTVKHLLLWQSMVCAIAWGIALVVAVVAYSWMRWEQRKARLRSRVRP